MNGNRQTWKLAALVVAGTLAVWGLSSLRASRKAAEVRYERSLSAKNQVEALASEAAHYPIFTSEKAANGEAPSLLAAVEDLARTLGIRDRLKSVTPATGTGKEAVSVAFEGLQFHEAIQVIYHFEEGTPWWSVPSCSLEKEYRDPSRVDVALRIEKR